MKTDTPADPALAKPRKYARGEARREQILAEAVRFFAEVGFEGQTRELAKRVGISHTALYRHFENKEALVEAVYKRVYLDRWNPEWDSLVTDRTRPLEDRLQDFYVQYAERVFDYEWVRIFMFSGLMENGLTTRYLTIVRDKVILPVLAELAEQGVIADTADSHAEHEEALWALHGGIFYIAIRRYVYRFGAQEHSEAFIRKTVVHYLRSLRAHASERGAAHGGPGASDGPR
ncbi:MAG: TetR/AcrR family transcriptional regulator [Rhodobacteraceae bacterium]|nr:MAG: TetR/AcrR family transcriptional regulator [Paracoccaceae bacterium]